MTFATKEQAARATALLAELKDLTQPYQDGDDFLALDEIVEQMREDAGLNDDEESPNA